MFQFSNSADSNLANLALHHGFPCHELLHKDGEKVNMGSPLGKTLVKYSADRTLTSPGGEAKEALKLNAVLDEVESRTMKMVVGRPVGGSWVSRTWRIRMKCGA